MRESHADSPAWNAERRRQIALQNSLAKAVRWIMENQPEPPVARLEIGRDPLG